MFLWMGNSRGWFSRCQTLLLFFTWALKSPIISPNHALLLETPPPQSWRPWLHQVASILTVWTPEDPKHGDRCLSAGSPLLRLSRLHWPFTWKSQRIKLKKNKFYLVHGKVEKAERRKKVKTQAQRSKQERPCRARERERARTPNKRKKLGHCLSSPKILLRSPTLPILKALWNLPVSFQ